MAQLHRYWCTPCHHPLCARPRGKGLDEAAAVVVLYCEDTHAVEGNYNLGSGLLADVGQLHVAVEGNAPMVAQVIEQHLLALAVADGLGRVFLGTLGLLTQDALMQAAG